MVNLITSPSSKLWFVLSICIYPPESLTDTISEELLAELLLAELLLDESLFFAQEMTVKLKRNMKKIMGIYLTRFPITGQSR